MLDKYHKSYIENSMVKKKEYYASGILKRIIFYKENEWRAGQIPNYFGNDWASMTYYHHANPMIPQ